MRQILGLTVVLTENKEPQVPKSSGLVIFKLFFPREIRSGFMKLDTFPFLPGLHWGWNFPLSQEAHPFTPP